jgi:hypothetical protein
MAFNYSPKIVTDGLVLYLDAANQYSYVSGSTSWNDISRGGNNGTLVNGPTYNSANGGSIVFDGTNDYVSGSTQNLSTYTMCIMIKISAFRIGAGIFGGNDGINPYIQLGGNNNWQFNNAFVSTNTPTLNQWTYVCGVQTSTNIQNLYVNQTLVNSASGFSSTLNNNYLIAQRSIGAIHTNCTVGFAQIYNKALTAQEIQQNYNATKTRFGLT